MNFLFQRHLHGQSPLGVFSNLWPTALCRMDRKTLESWYLCLHVGTWRVSLLGGV